MTRKKKQAPEIKYPGPLATPVAIGDPPLAVQILGPDHPDVAPIIKAVTDRAAQELMDKLPLLLDHFSIPPDAPDKWQELAFMLARAHVPGFRTVRPKKAGAPQNWGEIELAALQIEVETLTKQGMTAMEACRALLRLRDGGWRFPRCRDEKTLYRRYQQAKSLHVGDVALNIRDADLRQVIQESIIETAAEGWNSN